MLHHEEAIRVLALGLQSSHTKIVAETAQMMACSCLLVDWDGHARVLEGITLLKQPPGVKRFGRLVQMLRVGGHTHLKSEVLKLINAIVNIPDELDMRIHLRNEFYSAGWHEVVPPLQAEDTSDDIRESVLVFEEGAADDWAELLARFGDVRINSRRGYCSVVHIIL